MTLRIEAVSKRLGGRRVLDRVRLTVERGIVAVTGENGSGKSTLLRIVAGVLVPDEGSVFLKDMLIERSLQNVGYVPEKADPPQHLTIAELLALAGALRRAAPLDGATLERLGVAAILDQRLGTLSLGQRRRACLAAALIGAPWLLVLDEPSNGLDPGGVEMLAGVLREHAEKGGAALVATHDLDFADAAKAIRFHMGAARGVLTS